MFFKNNLAAQKKCLAFAITPDDFSGENSFVNLYLVNFYCLIIIAEPDLSGIGIGNSFFEQKNLSTAFRQPGQAL